MVNQIFNPRSSPEDIILGNDALMKCSIPSFVSDFVSVHDWEDSEGNVFFQNDKYGKKTRGFRCLMPHFVYFQPFATKEIGFISLN